MQKTALGKIIRATAENRDMAEGLGVDAGKIYAVVFTAGCMLGTLGGALVVPASAASLDMAVELIVEAFAVVVIGGLGSMRGALFGAVIVGLVRALAITKLPGSGSPVRLLIVIVDLDYPAERTFGKGTGMTTDTIAVKAPKAKMRNHHPRLGPSF